jgi:hypothetical protein
MNIHTEPGTTVVYVGDLKWSKEKEDYQYSPPSKDSINWGGHCDPTDVLVLGETYTIEHIEIHSWHTKVYLEEVPNKSFNSVWFEENWPG